MSRRRFWWPKSLRRQLVLGVSGIVTAVLLMVCALSVYSLYAYVTAMSDAELSRSLAAFSHSFEKYQATQAGHGWTNRHTAGSISEEAMTEFIGQAPGNLIAVLHDGRVVGSVLFSDEEPHAPPPEVVAAIEAQDWAEGPARTVKLDGLGDYRVQSEIAPDGDQLVCGVSLDPAEQVVTRKIIGVATLMVVALVGTALITVLMVRYALEPLRRVAATAGKVARLPLAGQEQRITARVSDKYTDPDNEVGIVGATLNRLLANVDSALVARAESDRRMRQFLTDASHELRTPLAAIQGYAELTRQDSAALPETSEYALARIEAEARRMSGLVNDLLLLSRLDEGQDLESDDVDLTNVATNVVNDIALLAPGHHWAVDVPDDPVWVRGDRARLHQMISNLLNNARVHTPDGVTVTTRVAARPGDDADGAGYAEVTVTDDGPDIDPELLPNLFERFVRADKSRSRELGSTGLGLAIVASIVEAHHGTVTVESSGGITVFRVHLPLGEDPS